jgi:aldose 1-epimerase
MSIDLTTAGFTRLTTASGTSLVVSPFGARVVELWMPDRHGTLGNVVLGLPSHELYAQYANLYLGCTVGRVAGRIPASRFVGGGLDFAVTPNEGANHLHGGPSRSFDRVMWELTSTETPSSVVATFHYTSPAGEEGYPGQVEATSSFELSADGVFTSTLTARTTAPCPINLTTHAYWNLSGIAGSTIEDHVLELDAVGMLETNAEQLPTGGTIPPSTQPALTTPGLDDTCVLTAEDHLSTPAAKLTHPSSGRAFSLFTTEPALQVYTGGHLPWAEIDKDHSLRPFGGLCLEPQRIGDNPQLPQYPSIVVQPGVEYRQVTRHVFSAK